MFRARRAASRGHNFLSLPRPRSPAVLEQNGPARPMRVRLGGDMDDMHAFFFSADLEADPFLGYRMGVRDPLRRHDLSLRSEEHTSELQSLMRISYAVFCLKKK